MPPNVAKEVLIIIGFEKDQLRQIRNLRNFDCNGYLDHDEYVIAMFLCDAVIQKQRSSMIRFVQRNKALFNMSSRIEKI